MNKNMKKESFIKILMGLSIEEINRIIEQKGKKPKQIPMVTFYK